MIELKRKHTRSVCQIPARNLLYYIATSLISIVYLIRSNLFDIISTNEIIDSNLFSNAYLLVPNFHSLGPIAEKMEIKGTFWRFWRVSISRKMERIRSPAIYHSKEKKQKRRCGSKWPWIFAIRPLFVLVQPFYHATIWSPTAWSIIFYRILGTKMEEAGG